MEIKFFSKPLEETDMRHLELVKEIGSMKEAIKASVRESGKSEKQFYLELAIDNAQWSRIMSGQAHFPENKLADFMAIAENEIPLEWLAYRMGYEIRIFPKTLEEKLLEKEAELAELKKKTEIMEECMRTLGLKANTK